MSSTNLSISVKNNDDYVVVSLNGKIEDRYYNLFLKKLQDVLFLGHQNIFIDFSELQFISSLGIGAVMEARNYTMGHGGKFILIGLKNQIQQVFDLIGLLKHLDVCATLDEAVSRIYPQTSV